MQKEGSDNDSQTGDEAKENDQPAAKRMRAAEEEWETSEMNFLVETPVSLLFIVASKLIVIIDDKII
jgi:hypothetical protein